MNMSVNLISDVYRVRKLWLKMTMMRRRMGILFLVCDLFIFGNFGGYLVSTFRLLDSGVYVC